MQRFYIEESLLGNNIFIKDKLIINQLIKVLRVKKQYKLIFFNGEDSKDYVYELIDIQKKQIEFKYIDCINKESTGLCLTLYQAIPNKIEKIEYILQKGVEVGIKKIIFYRSYRSQKLNISEKKILRFKNIIKEAVEQSNQNIIPCLDFFDGFNFGSVNGDINLFLDTKNDNSKILKKMSFTSKNNINIFVGPEGGFGEEEIKKFERIGFSKIYLGNNILRTETAGVVVGFYINQQVL